MVLSFSPSPKASFQAKPQDIQSSWNRMKAMAGSGNIYVVRKSADGRAFWA